MRFARRIFTFAAIYGLLILTPQYFLEKRIGQDFPPPITHPEHFYGFVGVALAWQVMFLVIARDPVRYRLAMLPAILEKATFGIAAIVLYLQHRIPVSSLVPGLFDLVLGTLFVLAYRGTPRDDQPLATHQR
ncbi:MAG TPA: hypothetical protein VG817_09890 [Gemmatimonadales bacterium]|nr:hypothetical protein [Gemmatimonadales bacterium]